MSPPHEAFAQAFARTNNAAHAWRVATGKSKNADVNGSAWLVKVGILPRVRAIRAEMAAASKITKDDAVAFLADVVLTPVGFVDSESRLAQEVKREEIQSSGDGPTVTRTRVKMPSKVEALKLLGLWGGWETGSEAENRAAAAIEAMTAAVRRKRREG